MNRSTGYVLESENSHSDIWTQRVYNTMWTIIRTCFVVATPCLISGITIGFSSIAIPQMHLNIGEASWFGCLYTLLAPVGAIMTGYIIDKFGRKSSLIACVIPGMIGYFLISRDFDLQLVFLGRALTGISVGAAFYPGQVYAAECLDANPTFIRTRSSFSNWASCASSIGFLLVFFLSIFMSYKYVATIAVYLSILFLFLIYFLIPESPVWLNRYGRYGDAEWSAKILRSSMDEDILQTPLVVALRRKDVYKPLIITSTIMFIMMLSGSEILSVYMVTMIKDNVNLSSYVLCTISGVLAVVGSICEVIIVPYTGIRKLCIFTCIVVSSCMYIYSLSTLYQLETLRVLSIWLGIYCHALGFYNIPRGILGEVFPPDAKQFAAGPTFVLFITGTVIIKIHPSLNASLGWILYLIYGTIGAFYTLFIYGFMPETVGRCLKEINEGF